MAYKQPYKQVKNSNDGASAIGAVAGIGALIAKLASAGKVAAAAAKAGKVAATTAKAAKAGKAAATAGKAAKGAKGAGQLTKMTTKGAKTIKTSSSMPKLQTLQQTADAGKKGGKFAQKIGDAGKKALDKGKDIVEKGKQKVDKFKEGYDKAAGKVADATGFEKEAVKEFGTNQTSNVASNIQSKIQEMIFNELSWDKMKSEYVKLFTDVYTIDELRGIAQFYKSPIGQSLIKKQPIIFQKSMMISQSKMQNLIPKLKKMTEEFAESINEK